ncbi:MAG: hypothetical protein FWC71_07665 [Defluviitaleaceae bacterium]|nr:hypothetical protein [Defluviitaleaceae bacterium]
MKNKPNVKNNHFLSAFFSDNFRNDAKQMWLLDCNTGKVDTRNTGRANLFAKRRAWDQDIEDAFNNIENKFNPKINQLLNLPLATFHEYWHFDLLPKSYDDLFTYMFAQTMMLQLSNEQKSIQNTNKKTVGVKTMLEGMLHSGINVPGNGIIIIRFNPKIYAECPLVLIDNITSTFVLPHQGKPVFAFITVISPYTLLFAGTREQFDAFFQFYPTTHMINVKRILQEDKKCYVVSCHEQYIKFLQTEIKYKIETPNAISVRSARTL